MSECKHKYKLETYKFLPPSIFCGECEGADLKLEEIVRRLNAFEMLKDDSPFDMIMMKERAEKAEENLKEVREFLVSNMNWHDQDDGQHTFKLTVNDVQYENLTGEKFEEFDDE